MGESWDVALGLSGQVQALEASLEALAAENGGELATRRLMAATVENMSEWELRSILGAVPRISTADLELQTRIPVGDHVPPSVRPLPASGSPQIDWLLRMREAARRP